MIDMGKSLEHLISLATANAEVLGTVEDINSFRAGYAEGFVEAINYLESTFNLPPATLKGTMEIRHK